MLNRILSDSASRAHTLGTVSLMAARIRIRAIWTISQIRASWSSELLTSDP